MTPRALSISAQLDRLASVRGFVRETAADAGCSDEVVDDLVQAVDESVTNVIEHGYMGRPGNVEVELECAPERVTIRIRDTAPPFDPTEVPTPDTTAPLAARRLGGMGVHLARVLTDEMRHRILPGGGNELTLIKALEGTRGGSDDGDRR